MRIAWEISDESIRYIRLTAREVSLSLCDLDEIEECMGVEVVSEMHKDPLETFANPIRWATIHILCRKRRGYPVLPRNWLQLSLGDDGVIRDRSGAKAKWPDDEKVA
jgi:hypothetical protein